MSKLNRIHSTVNFDDLNKKSITNWYNKEIFRISNDKDIKSK